MNLKQTIRKVLREDTDRSIINKILRRVDLDSAFEAVLTWSFEYYKPRLKDMTENDFVFLVIHNLYIDHISPIFEDWSDEDYEMPTITISEKEENKIQSFLTKLYSDRIKHAFQKETTNIGESILKEEIDENTLKILRRVNFYKLDEYFNEALNICSIRYLKFKRKLKNMNDQKFKEMVIADLMQTHYGDIESEMFDNEPLFTELWEFLTMYYSKPMERMFRKLNKIDESFLAEEKQKNGGIPSSLLSFFEKRYPTLVKPNKLTQKMSGRPANSGYGSGMHDYTVYTTFYMDDMNIIWFKEFDNRDTFEDSKWELNEDFEKIYNIFGEKLFEKFIQEYFNLDITDKGNKQYNWVFR